MSNERKKINHTIRKGARITYSVIWNLILIFIVMGIMGLTFAGGVGAGYFASLVKNEPIRSYDSMKKDIYNYEETTDLYFKNNVYLGKLRSDLDREEVDLENVSDFVKKALIATEDAYFYEHEGVVPKAILRAMFQELSNSSVRTGGSTLTQQLIKNQILTNEVSFERKAKEMLIALRLERFFEKDEILEAYLNVATFGRNSSGRNIAGIQTASEGIFGVNASELNLAQAAYLAGLPQSPFGYTPFTRSGELKNNLEPGLNRMKTVLSRMLSEGFITQRQFEEANEFDLVASFAPPKPSPVQKYPWLAFEIEQRATSLLAGILAKQDGYTEEDLQLNKELYNEYIAKADRDLRRNGYQIYSTIDKEIYDQMQQIKNNYEYYGSDKPESVKDPDTGETIKVLEPVEVGAMLIENRTGAILSFVGGRDHEREQLNHATRAKRPNGSTMKPLLVYAPAMELGLIQPGSVIPDVEMEIQAGPDLWNPKNYGGGYHGLTSARYALARSYNVPAARTYIDIIENRPTSYLENMGFTSLTKGDHTNFAMALGGMTNGVTIEENVNAYATFGNYGKFVDAYMIDKIVAKNGDIIYVHESDEVDVFTPQTSYLTLDMMRDVVQRGTAASLNNYINFEADWAGKTGTTQDYKDAWFVATNPNVTFGTWIGYDTPKSLEKSYKGLSYSRRNIQLWAQLMNAAYELRPEVIQPNEQFNMPGGIVRRSYCAVSGLLPSEVCKEAGLISTDLFNAKFVPDKEDDSFEKEKYVSLNGKAYRTLETTPMEFTLEGIMLKQEFIESLGVEQLEDLSKLIPNQESWNSIIITEREPLPENGYVPTPVTNISFNGKQMTWQAHPHQDVIGYRIYESRNPIEGFKQVLSIPASKETLSATISNALNAYYITAVDVAGNESSPSEIITLGNWLNPSQQNEEEDQSNVENSETSPLPNDEDMDGRPTDSNEEGNKNNEDTNPDSPPTDEDSSSVPDPFSNINDIINNDNKNPNR